MTNQPYGQQPPTQHGYGQSAPYGGQPTNVGHGGAQPHGVGGVPPQQGGYPGAPAPGAHPGGGYHGAGQTPMPNPHEADLKKLENDSMMWLIVGIAGFWFGFSWATGPIAWIMGSKMKAKYRERGMEPHNYATWAWIVGIGSTALTLLGVLAAVLFVVFFVGLAGFAAVFGA